MRKGLMAIALLLLVQPAQALPRNDANRECYYSPTIAGRIAGCTALIKMTYQESDKMGAYDRRAQTYLMIGELDHAIADETEAIRLGPYYVPSYLTRADAYESKGQDSLAAADRAQAVKVASEEIAQVPESADSYISRARAYRALGDKAKALADAAKAVKLTSADIQPLRDAGEIFLALGRTDDTMNAYTMAISRQRNAGAYRDRGWIYHLQGFAGRAIRDLTIAVEMDPEDPYAYDLRGQVFEAAGNRAFAIIDYRKAVKLNTHYEPPKDALTRLGVAP